MKNIYKLFALLCVGGMAISCVDEIFVVDDKPKYDTTPGNEIIFTATAHVSDGMPTTKTVYGDTNVQDKDDNTGKLGTIEINWDDDDRISIVSPNAVGAEVAHYNVVPTPLEDEYNDSHYAAELERIGDAGLQWSKETIYDFYAVYPSVLGAANSNLSKSGVLSAELPFDQSGTATYEGNGYVVSPNMDYAFMTASCRNYSRVNENNEQNSEAISLNFNSLVTALQFEIVAGQIGGGENTNIQDYIDILSVSLLAKENTLSGLFTYDIAHDTYESSNVNGSTRVIMHFDDLNDPVRLKANQSLDFTFFVLPENIQAGTLDLQVVFTLNGVRTSKTATISSKIEAGKKYVFKDVRLPNFSSEIPPSGWWDTMDPEVLLSQISIPVASNVFANDSYDVDDIYFQQQQLTIDELWDMGVRGFEICNQSMVYAQGQLLGGSIGPSYEEVLAGDLDAEPVIAAEKELSETFSGAIDNLYGLLQSNPSECLILICTYIAVNDGYNPYVYVANLFNSLDNFCERNKFDPNGFVQISASTTVEDIKGKIAIIIRPGDDERWLYENGQFRQGSAIRKYQPQTDPFITLGDGYDSNLGLTGSIVESLDSDWWNRVLLVSDWGASYDVWDRRYGPEYARAAEFNDMAVSRDRADEKSHFENYLYGISNTYTQIGTIGGYVWGGDVDANGKSLDNNFNNFGGKSASNYPSLLKSGFNFTHKMSNSNYAYVQEWMRVVPQGGIGPIAISRSGSSNSGETLWAYWPESITEKKDAIKALFNKSVKTLANKNSTDLYINVLTGYYVTPTRINSVYPYKGDYTGSTRSFELNDMAEGGDFKNFASEINTYTYNLLTAETGLGGKGLDSEGPWGLVMMDHINRNDNSYKLVDLIMRNNFKFPLATKCNVCGMSPCVCPPTEEGISKSYNATYSNGGEAISFE